MDSPLPDPRAVTVTLTGPVAEVARFRAALEARAAFADSGAVDLEDGSVQCRMTVVAGEQ